MKTEHADYYDFQNKRAHTPFKTYPSKQRKGQYCLTIYNKETKYTTYHGYISSSAVLCLVGRFIIGIDFQSSRFYETISAGHLEITIENTAR